MNERIKELIKSLGIIPEDEHYEVAELIVRECIEVVSSHYHKIYESPAEDAIKEHFGVQ